MRKLRAFYATGLWKTPRFRRGEMKTAKGDQIMRKVTFIVMVIADVY